jgi:hypothetical protein
VSYSIKGTGLIPMTATTGHSSSLVSLSNMIHQATPLFSTMKSIFFVLYSYANTSQRFNEPRMVFIKLSMPAV